MPLARLPVRFSCALSLALTGLALGACGGGGGPATRADAATGGMGDSGGDATGGTHPPTDAGHDLGQTGGAPVDARAGGGTIIDMWLDVGADGSGPPKDAGPDGAVPTEGACTGTYTRPTETGRLDDDRLTEVSGIAASHQNQGVLWVHNDSGDLPRIFALNTVGHLLGVVYLRGVENVDWEDIAVAGCPDGSGPCIWVADSGDNGGRRAEFNIQVVREPAVDPAGFADLAVDVGWHYTYRFPDDVHDAEALAVPADGSGFSLFEKVDGPRARLYRWPGALLPDTATTLELVTTFDSPGFNVALGHMITGSSLHPDGRRLLVRVYTGSYEYRLPPGEGLEALSHLTPLRVAAGPLSEPQGEAIGYDAAGTGVFTVSEDTDHTGQVPLHHYDCVP